MKTYIKPFTHATEIESLHIIADSPNESSLGFKNVSPTSSGGTATGWFSKGTEGWEDEDKAE